jgi:hypothetical protein
VPASAVGILGLSALIALLRRRIVCLPLAGPSDWLDEAKLEPAWLFAA